MNAEYIRQRKSYGKIISWARKGIRRMLEFSKRWGPYFFTAFIALALGIVQVFIFLKDSPCLMRNLGIMLSILALICFILTMLALFYDLMDICRKNRDKKREDSHKALVESFMKTGMSRERAEIAATGRPAGPPIDGLDEDGWSSPREAYNKSHREV
jgi:uncharacterized membrane protein